MGGILLPKKFFEKSISIVEIHKNESNVRVPQFTETRVVWFVVADLEDIFSYTGG